MSYFNCDIGGFFMGGKNQPEAKDVFIEIWKAFMGMEVHKPPYCIVVEAPASGPKFCSNFLSKQILAALLTKYNPMFDYMIEMNFVRTVLVQGGIEYIKEMGYSLVDETNIFTDYSYGKLFKQFLEHMKEQPEMTPQVHEIESLINEIK